MRIHGEGAEERDEAGRVGAVVFPPRTAGDF